MLKEIRVGAPFTPLEIGVADTFILAPVLSASNSTFEIPKNSFCAHDLADVLKSITKIEVVDKPISVPESILKYGVKMDRPDGYSGKHACIDHLERYGLPTSRCVPRAKPSEVEILWAQEFLKSFRNPIIFTPIPGHLKTKFHYTAVGKYLPPEYWERTLLHLSKSNDILYVTSRDNYFEMPHCIPIIGYPIAKVAAMMYLSKKHLGIENGLKHLAVAMGCISHIFIPSFGWFNNHCFPIYMYTKEMYQSSGESQRTFYRLFSEVGYNPRPLIEIPNRK